MSTDQVKKETRKYCYKPQDVPTEDHFAVVEFSSVWISDNDSRGGGYTESRALYIAFTDEDEWKLYVSQRTQSNDKNFVPVRVKRAKVTINVEVDID